MRILALDPGTSKTAYVLWDGETVHCKGIVNNIDMRTLLVSRDLMPYDLVAIEMPAYARFGGNEIMHTARWVGVFEECARGTAPCLLVNRSKVKRHLGKHCRNDSHVRAALIARYGEPGTAKNPGRLYGISSHLWAALAVADYAFAKGAEES